jgi:hypothetical protein
MMPYLLLIYDNEKRWSQGYDAKELEQYRAFGKEYAAAIQGGHALQPTATAATVRVRDGKALSTDGPFAETKGQLAGCYLVEAPSREEAVGHRWQDSWRPLRLNRGAADYDVLMIGLADDLTG